jgi:integrase
MERIAQKRAQDAQTPRRTGRIQKRGEDTWLVRIFTGLDAQGKRRYINKTIKGKKKDADTYLSKTLSSMRTGTFVEPLRMTLEEYLDKWLQTAASPRLRLRTYEYYEEMLKSGHI